MHLMQRERRPDDRETRTHARVGAAGGCAIFAPAVGNAPRSSGAGRGSLCMQMARYGLGHGHETSLEHALPRTLSKHFKPKTHRARAIRLHRGKKLRQERCVSGVMPANRRWAPVGR